MFCRQVWEMQKKRAERRSWRNSQRAVAASEIKSVVTLILLCIWDLSVKARKAASQEGSQEGSCGSCKGRAIGRTAEQCVPSS